MDLEKQIAIRYAGGEECATELVDSLNRALMGSALRLTKDYQVAEDLLQVSWVKIFKALKKGSYREDSDASFKTWAKQVLKNAFFDYLRRAKTLPLDNVSSEPIDMWRDEVVGDKWEEVVRYISRLPKKMQDVVLLRLDGKKFDDISIELGISLVASKSRMFRAIRMMRKMVA